MNYVRWQERLLDEAARGPRALWNLLCRFRWMFNTREFAEITNDEARGGLAEDVRLELLARKGVPVPTTRRTRTEGRRQRTVSYLVRPYRTMLAYHTRDGMQA